MNRSPRQRWSTRKFLRALAGTSAAAVAGFSYRRWVEPTWLAVRNHELPLPTAAGPRAAGARPIRLLHLSDFRA